MFLLNAEYSILIYLFYLKVMLLRSIKAYLNKYYSCDVVPKQRAII